MWPHVLHANYKGLLEGFPAPLKEEQDPLLVSGGRQGPRVTVT